MTIDVTIDVPAAYPGTFTIRVEHGIMLDVYPIEFSCNDDEKSTRNFDR